MLTLFIAAPSNGGSFLLRVVDEVSGAVFEQEITADLPANMQCLSPRLFMNNGATAAAVAYDCAGACVKTLMRYRNFHCYKAFIRAPCSTPSAMDEFGLSKWRLKNQAAKANIVV